MILLGAGIIGFFPPFDESQFLPSLRSDELLIMHTSDAQTDTKSGCLWWIWELPS